MIARRIIIANWKMNPLTQKEAEKLFIAESESLKSLKLKKTDVVVCPPNIYLGKLKSVSKKIDLGAQNIFSGDIGPFTGEVSVSMMNSLGIKYTILGHSERRSLGETNELINKKIKSSLSSGIIPILCIGEKDRDSNHAYLDFIRNQLLECLQGVQKNNLSKLIIAYEPIWALSTTINRHDFVPAEFLEIKIFIKKVLTDYFGSKVDLPRIIYGGSARPDNALSFIREGQAEGLLVGKDSLNSKKFLEIIKIADNA